MHARRNAPRQHGPSLLSGGGAPANLSSASFGETLAFAAPVTTGNYVDGPAWIVVPGGGLSVLSRSTPEATDAGYAINGAMLNPQRTLTAVPSPQAFDARLTTSYIAGLKPTWPLSVAAGDILVCAIGQPGVAVPDARRGVVQKYCPFFFVSAAPPVNAFAPAAIGWTGRGTPQHYVLDVAPLVAALPNYASTGHNKPPIGSILSKFDRFEIATGMCFSTVTDGYEWLHSYQAGWADSNYGRYLAQWCGAAGFALISDAADATQKASLLRRMISKGIQAFEPVKATGATEAEGNGGHWQFDFLPKIIALNALGRTADLDTLHSVDPGNILSQPFVFDAAMVAATTAPHSDMTKPFHSRRRTIAAVSGTTITLNMSRSGNTGDPAQVNFSQLVLTRESDGAQATVSSQISGTSTPGGATTKDVAINAQPGTPFAVGDTVWLAAPHPIVVGDADWIIGKIASPYAYSPSYLQTYRNFAFYAEELLTARALGIWRAEWNAMQAYTERAYQTSVPTVANDYPGPCDAVEGGYTWAADFWAAHKASIVPSLFFPFDLYNEAGSTTLTDWPALRVSINNGAWQTLSAAGLTLTSFDGVNDEVVFSGLTGSETSIRLHNEQEQQGEPYNAANSISALYAKRTGGPGPVCSGLPGIPIAATIHDAPVEATL